MILGVLSLAVSAQTPFQESASSVSQGSLIFFGALLIVFAVVKRFQKTPKTAAAETLKVIARKNLAPRQSLMVLEVEGKKVLIGVSAEQIQLLTELEDPFPAASDSSFEQTLLTLAPATAAGDRP